MVSKTNTTECKHEFNVPIPRPKQSVNWKCSKCAELLWSDSIYA